jgi:superfamily II DNA/RNA helicase
LVSHGFDAAALHGDMDQRARTTALDAFRNGETALLVASDVAARGLDIPAVSHVFNFDVPHHPEDYVHRIGRTGRAGRAGTAYTLVSPEDTRSLGAIEALIGQPIPWLDGDLTTVAEPSEDTGTRHRGRSAETRRGGRSARAGSKSAGEAGGDRPKARGSRSGSAAQRAESRPVVPRGEPVREERGRRHEAEGDTPIGLGSHVPAFLLRPILAKKEK